MRYIRHVIIDLIAIGDGRESFLLDVTRYSAKDENICVHKGVNLPNYKWNVIKRNAHYQSNNVSFLSQYDSTRTMLDIS